MSGGKNSLQINVDNSAIDRLIDSLGTDLEAATRPAAQAGAQVLYDEVKRNVAKIGKVKGNLERSIYQKFSPENSGTSFAEYHVSWNHKKASHGHWLEYGHLQRYKARMLPSGKWITLIRPEILARMRKGEIVKKPGRHASQEAKDAFYVLSDDVNRRIGAFHYTRDAVSKFGEAASAMSYELVRYINEGPLRNRG